MDIFLQIYKMGQNTSCDLATSLISSLACWSLSGLLAHSSLASASLFFCSVLWASCHRCHARMRWSKHPWGQEQPPVSNQSPAGNQCSHTQRQKSQSFYLFAAFRSRGSAAARLPEQPPTGECSLPAIPQRWRSRWPPAPDAAAPSCPPTLPTGTEPGTGPCCPPSFPTWPCFWQTRLCSRRVLGLGEKVYGWAEVPHFWSRPDTRGKTHLSCDSPASPLKRGASSAAALRSPPPGTCPQTTEGTKSKRNITKLVKRDFHPMSPHFIYSEKVYLALYVISE